MIKHKKVYISLIIHLDLSLPEASPAGPCSVSSNARSSFQVCRAGRSRPAAVPPPTSHPAGRGTPPRTHAAASRCPSPSPGKQHVTQRDRCHQLTSHYSKSISLLKPTVSYIKFSPSREERIKDMFVILYIYITDNKSTKNKIPKEQTINGSH